MKIRSAKIRHLAEIANIHCQSSAGALSGFSAGFIRDYYANALSCKDCRLLIGELDDAVVGFVLLSVGHGCIAKKLLLRRPFSLAWRLIRGHGDFFRLLRLAFMPSGAEDQAFMPELVYIVVDGAFRGGGRGRLLFAASLDLLRAENVAAFRLFVETKNHPARDMYISFGGRVYETTQSYGEKVEVIHFSLQIE